VVLPGRAGQILHAGAVRIRVLSPPGPAPTDRDADPNLTAIVLLLSYRGLDFLMTADAESDVTASVPLRPVDVLKVAHHGSADEGLASLLSRIRPREAVIEVGGANPFGHPAPRTVATLESLVPRVYRTDRDGEVAVSAP
jgi:competence protein ComEC